MSTPVPPTVPVPAPAVVATNSSVGKGELVDKLAVAVGASKKSAQEFFDAFVKLLQQEVINGNKVTLIGFGTFLVRQRSARTGRNPKTGDPLTIPAKKMPAFKAGMAFKRAVNGDVPLKTKAAPTPKAPRATKAPAAPKTPKTPKAPKTPKTPKTPKAPRTPKSAKSAKTTEP